MKLFIFDMGNVFLTGIAIIRNMAESIGIPEEALRSDYAEHEHALMDGSMLPEEYYRHLEDKFGVKVEGNPFLEFFRPSSDENVLSVCDDLRSRGFRCAVGSNTFAPHWEYVKEMPSDPLSHFDSLYASHLIHLAKPDPAFWMHICMNEGISPSDTVFIDDLEENCMAAESAGLVSFIYAGDDRLSRLQAFIGEIVNG